MLTKVLSILTQYQFKILRPDSADADDAYSFGQGGVFVVFQEIEDRRADGREFEILDVGSADTLFATASSSLSEIKRRAGSGNVLAILGSIPHPSERVPVVRKIEALRREGI
jgi:hypothetical protein